MKDKAFALLTKVREQTPMVHHITNLVVTNFTANTTLAMGGSPVMAYAAEEVEEMAAVAGALVLNIGTLTPELIEAMVLAGQAANRASVPVVLDPVGNGATRLRTESTRRLLEEVEVDILRGNLSEVAGVAGKEVAIRGVDSTAEGVNGGKIALDLAAELGCTVAITGVSDFVSDGSRVFKVDNGHSLLTYITGSGCGATGAVALFAAVDEDRDYALAAASALACYGLAGEMAAKGAEGPGSFSAQFMDRLYLLDEKDLKQGIKISLEGESGE